MNRKQFASRNRKVSDEGGRKMTERNWVDQLVEEAVLIVTSKHMVRHFADRTNLLVRWPVHR